MIYLTMEVRPGNGMVPVLEDFVKINPADETNLTHPASNRDKIHVEIQRAVERTLGADARLLQILGTHGSPEVLLMIVVAGGAGGYKFIKDYPDLRQGVLLLISDIRRIIKKISGEDLEVNEKYPPEAGEDIRRVATDRS